MPNASPGRRRRPCSGATLPKPPARRPVPWTPLHWLTAPPSSDRQLRLADRDGENAPSWSTARGAGHARQARRSAGELRGHHPARGQSHPRLETGEVGGRGREPRQERLPRQHEVTIRTMNAIPGSPSCCGAAMARARAIRRNTSTISRPAGATCSPLINDIPDLVQSRPASWRSNARPCAPARHRAPVLRELAVRRARERLALGPRRWTVRCPSRSAPTPRRPRQIILNLCPTPSKFTETGGVTVRRPASRAAATALSHPVRDTGIGVAPTAWSRCSIPSPRPTV